MPPNNAASVAPGTDVSFPQDGPNSGTGIARTSDSSFSLSEIGTYLVEFFVSVDEAGQLILTLNGADLEYTVAGCATGAIYGVLSLLIAGVIYHPMSILLDYVLAFGLLGLAGFFKKNVWGVVSGCFVGVLGRFLSSLVSGAVLFAEYAPSGQNPWIYSLIYQATYLVPEFIISAVIIVLLFTKAHRLFEN